MFLLCLHYAWWIVGLTSRNSFIRNPSQGWFDHLAVAVPDGGARRAAPGMAGCGFQDGFVMSLIFFSTDFGKTVWVCSVSSSAIYNAWLEISQTTKSRGCKAQEASTLFGSSHTATLKIRVLCIWGKRVFHRFQGSKVFTAISGKHHWVKKRVWIWQMSLSVYQRTTLQCVGTLF